MATPEERDVADQDSAFTSAEAYANLTAEADEAEEAKESYERYVGVCDVLSPEQARAMADGVATALEHLDRLAQSLVANICGRLIRDQATLISNCNLSQGLRF